MQKPCFLAILLAVDAMGAGTVSIDELRKANRLSISEIKTATVGYRSSLERTPLQDFPGVGSANGDGNQRRILSRVNLAFEADDETIVTFDAGGPVWKTERRDLRDIDALLAAGGLPERERVNIDRTRIELRDLELEGLLVARANHLLIDDRSKGHVNSIDALLATPLRAGCYPDQWITDNAPLSVQECLFEGRRAARLTIELATGTRVLYLDPTIGYRFRRVEVYRADGSLSQLETADDYRKLDGLYYPFNFEQEQYSADGAVTKHLKVSVLHASFNHDLPEGALSLAVPAGTRFQHIQSGSRGLLSEDRAVQMTDLHEWKAALIQQAGL